MSTTCPTCRGSGVVSNDLALAAGKVGRHHPETSRRAARSASNRLTFGTQRWRVTEALLERAKTAAEIADDLGMSRNQVATRLQELREAGLTQYVVVNGERVTRQTSNGSTGLVQQLTPYGAHQAKSMLWRRA